MATQIYHVWFMNMMDRNCYKTEGKSLIYSILECVHDLLCFVPHNELFIEHWKECDIQS